MRWRLSYAASAVRALRKLDPQVQRKIKAALEELSCDPERGKPLQFSLKGLRSWRTGDYRIVYRIAAEAIEILDLVVGHRREVYERLRRTMR